MKLVDLKVEDFIVEVGSSSPAPGGGSVSALTASIGVALSNMVGKLSVTKKKYKALDIEVQNQFEVAMNELEEIRNALKKYVDKDTEAFNEIMGAFKLPKETEEEKSARRNAIQNATLRATKVPTEVSNLCMIALQKIETIIPYINKNTMSDIGVSVLMIQAGLEGAAMNVLINTPGLKDEEVRNQFNNEIDVLIKDSRILKDRIVKQVYSKL